MDPCGDQMGSTTFRAWQSPQQGSSGYGKATDSDIYRVGIYGWRKRCLYALILILIVVIMINLAITIWIMRVLDFNLGGMGALKVAPGGIHVTGRTEFDHPVSFGRMTMGGGSSGSDGAGYGPDPDKPFVVESQAGLALISRSRTADNHNQSAKIIMEDNQIKTFCNHFEINDPKGNPLFYANKREVAVRVENLKIIGKSGSIFDSSVQTRLIRPETGHPLVLESPTRGLNATAAQDVEILSRAGDLRVEALHTIYLESSAGEIHFNSPNIFMARLMQAHDSGRGASQDQFQVCMCQNGRLFLARASVNCRSTPELCR